MGMFPFQASAEYLQSVPKRFGDVKSAVSQTDKGHFSVGFTWAFWMEDDPRQPDGILNLAKYKCVESGGMDSKWELIE